MIDLSTVAHNGAPQSCFPGQKSVNIGLVPHGHNSRFRRGDGRVIGGHELCFRVNHVIGRNVGSVLRRAQMNKY